VGHALDWGGAVGGGKDYIIITQREGGKKKREDHAEKHTLLSKKHKL